MEKISFKPGTYLSPLPVVMVSVGDMEKSNIITIAWTGVINSDPPYTYISVRKERFSHDIIETTGEFCINLVNQPLVKATDFCGVKSGRTVDKFMENNLTKVKCDNINCPMILESPINLECKVIEKHEYPSHDMYVSEIVGVHVSSDYVLPDGKIDYMNLDLVSYVHGEYVPLRKTQIGFFGFSVARPKILKKRSKEQHERRVFQNTEKREKKFSDSLELTDKKEKKNRDYKDKNAKPYSKSKKSNEKKSFDKPYKGVKKDGKFGGYGHTKNSNSNVNKRKNIKEER